MLVGGEGEVLGHGGIGPHLHTVLSRSDTVRGCPTTRDRGAAALKASGSTASSSGDEGSRGMGSTHTVGDDKGAEVPGLGCEGVER